MKEKIQFIIDELNGWINPPDPKAVGAGLHCEKYASLNPGAKLQIKDYINMLQIIVDEYDENKSKEDLLIQCCEEFIDEQEIICPEHIYQCDNVILNAAEFIENICDIVGYKEFTEDE